MARMLKMLIGFAILISICLSAAGMAMAYETPIDQVAAIAAAPEGRTFMASYERGAIRLRLLDEQGVVTKGTRLDCIRDGKLYSVADMAAGADGVLYLLFDLSDPMSGDHIGQELALYDLSALLRKRVARQTFDAQMPVRYHWLSVQSAVTLMGTDRSESAVIRESYDPAALYSRQVPQPLSRRDYPISQKDGVWKAVTAGSDLVYAAKSGKIFLAAEGEPVPREVYPNRVLTELMYPIFLAPQSADAVYIGEQESGNFLSLALQDGATQVLKNGTEPFSGISGYAPVDLRAVSMQDPQTFSALAPREDGGYSLISAYGGTVTVADQAALSLGGLVTGFLARFVKNGALLLLAILLAYGFFYLLGRGRTVFAKLVLSSLPLLAAALAVFGIFSYRAYADAIEQSFQKQVEDEGNLPEWEQEVTNRFFNLLNQAADRYDATLMADSVNLRRLTVVCAGGTADAVEIALAVLSEVDSINAALPMKNRMRPLLLLHSANVYYGICGDQDRLVPVLLSQELDAVSSMIPGLRQLGCRFLVTQAAFGQLSGQKYANRFIGYPEQNVRQIFGLYDFYDASTPEVTRLLDDTRPTFAKAMELYLERRYQEAKNLFALILRENQYDDVSRYYVFLCEKNL